MAPELVHRICAERAAGTSLAQIARDLNATHTATAHGGAQWWPSTVRAVLARSNPPNSAEEGEAPRALERIRELDREPPRLDSS